MAPEHPIQLTRTQISSAELQLVFPGVSEVAELAPATIYEQPEVVATMLELRAGLPRVRPIQELTERFAAENRDVPDILEACQRAKVASRAFHQMVTHAIQETGLAQPGIEVLYRTKTRRSIAAKALIRIAQGGDAAMPDIFACRVTTNKPSAFLDVLKNAGDIPEQLPGGIDTRQTTGSRHSIMYEHGHVGHKLVVPHRAPHGAVVLGEVLAYSKRGFLAYMVTRDGYEATRLKTLEYRIGTQALNAFNHFYAGRP